MKCYNCIDICPLPSNATGQVIFENLGNRTVGRGADTKIVPTSRRFRSFDLGRGASHETSVVIPTTYREGIVVSPTSQACDCMIKFFEYGLDERKRNGAMGGTLNCTHLSGCNYGSGNRQG